MARYDRMGMIWMLKGERVVALTATAARLSGGSMLRSHLTALRTRATASVDLSFQCVGVPKYRRVDADVYPTAAATSAPADVSSR